MLAHNFLIFRGIYMQLDQFNPQIAHLALYRPKNLPLRR